MKSNPATDNNNCRNTIDMEKALVQTNNDGSSFAPPYQYTAYYD